MLLTRFRWVSGAVTGGCLEGDISNKGWSLTKDGSPILVTYDSARLPEGADDDDIRAAFGLGCDGVVEVLLERAGQPGRLDALELQARCLRLQKRGVVATVFRSGDPEARVGARLGIVGSGALEEETERLPAALREAIAADMKTVHETGVSINRTYGNVAVLIEAVIPPPRMFLFGTGLDAVPVAQLAHSLGWDVVVCVPDAKYSVRERFAMADEVLVGASEEIAARVEESARAVSIVMQHDYDKDHATLGMLIGTRARYVGVLGPKSRTTRMLSELGCPDDARVHAAAGTGGETSQEIALTIVAEIQSSLAAHAERRRAPTAPPLQVERASASGSAATVAAGKIK